MYERHGDKCRQQRKLKNFKSSFWLYMDFIYTVFVHLLANTLRQMKIAPDFYVPS